MTFPVGLTAVAAGAGATVALDLWALLLELGFDIPATRWPMVGRWLGNLPRGRLVQPDLAKADPVAGEAAIGWIAHYVIGASYGLLLLAIAGRAWFAAPELWRPLLLSWALLVAPFLIMMPGMGLGLAAARTPRPWVPRFKSFASHTVFGLGLYVTARLLCAFGA